MKGKLKNKISIFERKIENKTKGQSKGSVCSSKVNTNNDIEKPG